MRANMASAWRRYPRVASAGWIGCSGRKASNASGAAANANAQAWIGSLDCQTKDKKTAAKGTTELSADNTREGMTDSAERPPHRRHLVGEYEAEKSFPSQPTP